MKCARVCFWVAVPIVAIASIAGGAQPPAKGVKLKLITDPPGPAPSEYRGGWVKPPSEEAKPKAALSPDDEATVRDVCYKDGLPPTALPLEGKYAFAEVALAPAALEAVYAKHPKEVLALLLVIAEGGNPWDSTRAIVYAYVLTEKPNLGALLVRHFSAFKYDFQNPGGKSTPRQFHTNQLKEHLKANKKD